MNTKENAPMYLSLKKILVIIIIAGSILIGLTGCGEKTYTESQPDENPPNQDVEVDETRETADEVIAELLPSLESQRISAELLSDPEALARVIIDERITDWINSGALEEILEAKVFEYDPEFIDGSQAYDDFGTETAAKYDPIYIQAIFGDNPDKNVLEDIELYTGIHAQNVRLYNKTSSPGVHPEDLEPYNLVHKVISVDRFVNNQDGTYTMTVTYEIKDNSEYNRVEETATDGTYVDGKIIEVITVAKQGENLIIVNIE